MSFLSFTTLLEYFRVKSDLPPKFPKSPDKLEKS
jgi:hypothetical protein